MTFFLFRAFLLGLIIMMPDFVIPGNLMASEKNKDDAELAKEVYIKVPPVSVNMYHRGLPRGNITISLWVKLLDGEKRASARTCLPRLSNAYVMEASRLSHDYFDVNRPVNVAMLGDAFQLATNKILGHEEAHVLVSDVIVHK